MDRSGHAVLGKRLTLQGLVANDSYGRGLPRMNKSGLLYLGFQSQLGQKEVAAAWNVIRGELRATC